ncbi:MAG: T9SS type A sorting domain-containing protein, partial [Fibromonadales bacterium]|nr:T9SS type A sorting domain-containing protein [Fibromonadales bacterium]
IGECTGIGGTVSETCEETPAIAISSHPQIQAYATPNSIVLENLPQNTKVEVYNLQGKQIYSANPENPKILKIPVQTKGVYIVQVGSNTYKVVR